MVIKLNLSELIVLIIKSVIVGICAILPGVSGSVIAVSFGIYDKFINIISNKKDIKNNISFLTIVTIGVIIGIILGSNMILNIFKYKTVLYYSLTGIILSEIPFIIKKIHLNSSKGIMFIPFTLAFLFSLILDILNKQNISSKYSVFKYFLGGILFSFGKVFPGISSSFFLLCLGIYDRIIALVLNPFLLIIDFYFYIPFIIGIIFGLIIFIKLLSFLMGKYFRFTYSIILGFIISSVVVLFPKFTFDFNHIIGIILMNVLFILFLFIKKKNNE